MSNKVLIFSVFILVLLSGCSNQVTQSSLDGKHKYVGTVDSDGIREGTGKFFTEGVLVYEGEYSNDLPNGEGRMYHENGNIMFIGEFRDGLYYRGIMYDEDGVKLGPYTRE